MRAKLFRPSSILAALGLFAVGAALKLVLPLGAQAPVEIVFASGPDASGTVERMVAAFNEEHRGAMRVVWRQLPVGSDAQKAALIQGLQSTSDRIDVAATDVVWTAELARSGRVEDITDRFYDALSRDDFLPAALRSSTYRLRIWGVPWYTDPGLLFYRRDKLAESGVTSPPATWEELAASARTVMSATGTPHGFVFQGAAYEGGTANASEFIWSAGGDIMSTRLEVTGVVVNTATEVERIGVGSEAAARGLDIARGLIESGVSPAEVADFREEEALEAFMAGDAVFLRSWPYAFNSLRQAGFTDDQVGVAALPAAGNGGESASCLGGYNLMINAASSDAERDAAWAWIQFLVDESRQRQQALEAGLLPVLEALYDDPELRGSSPVIGVGAEVFGSRLHERPMTPFYGELSARVSAAFNRTLRGELTGAQAAALLEREIRDIVSRNR